jgi:hypothetical protein
MCRATGALPGVETGVPGKVEAGVVERADWSEAALAVAVVDDEGLSEAEVMDFVPLMPTAR